MKHVTVISLNTLAIDTCVKITLCTREYVIATSMHEKIVHTEQIHDIK